MLLCRAALLFILLAISVPALAAPRVLVVTEDFPPFNYLDGNTVVGSSTAVVRAVFEKAGLAYDLKIMPWKRAMEKAEFEPNTFIYSMTRLPEREDRFHWLLPVGQNRFLLYCDKDRNDLLDMDAETVKRQGRVCIKDGTSARTLLVKAGFEPDNLIGLTDQDGMLCLNMVAEGRADFVPSSQRTHEHRVEEYGLKRRFAHHPSITISECMYLAAGRRTAPEIIEKVRKAYRELHDSGALDKLSEVKGLPCASDKTQ